MRRPVRTACLLLAVSATSVSIAETPKLPEPAIPGLRYYYPPEQVEPRTVEADVCVYGGTSGGVVAAVVDCFPVAQGDEYGVPYERDPDAAHPALALGHAGRQVGIGGHFPHPDGIPVDRDELGCLADAVPAPTADPLAHGYGLAGAQRHGQNERQTEQEKYRTFAKHILCAGVEWDPAARL